MASLMRFTADGESGMRDTPLFFRRAAAWVQLGFGSRGHVARPNSAAQILISSYGMDAPRTQADISLANRGRYEEFIRCVCWR
jgi:hypothetical protein